MKILNLIYDYNTAWSWGVVVKALQEELQKDFEFESYDFITWPKNEGDVILSQNVTQLKSISSLHKTIARLGGNRSFDTELSEHYLKTMAKCFAVVATNNGLKEIGLLTNPNTSLIPNGLNLDIWKPKKGRKWRMKRPRIGFIGNILSPEKRDYKGYDFVKEACENLGLELTEALYKKKQTPHDQMCELFWNKIDIFILPTRGEGCSNSIMEALACGVPTITTQCAGFHGELLKHGENVLFCERSVESVQEQLSLLLGNKALFKKLHLGGRAFAEEHHDVKQIAKQFSQLFKECYFAQEHTIG